MKNDVNGADGSIWNAAGIFIGRMRIAFRVLWKNPLITSSAIISIALGIGASVAMFTIFDEYLLRRLPVPEPERLVNFSSPGPIPGENYASNAGGFDEIFISYPMFRDLEKAQSVFTGIAAHRLIEVNISWREVGDKQQGMLVSGGYFSTLGLKPAIGRLLNLDDDKIIGEAHAAVLSYAYWQSRFEGDPGVLNQDITVNGQPMTIVGVAPRGFKGTTFGMNPQIFVPVTMRVEQQGMPMMPYRRIYYWLHVFGRLNPGVTLEQAAAVTNVQYRNFLMEYDVPETEPLPGVDGTIMNHFREKQLLLKPGARGQSWQFNGNEKMYIFMGGTLLLLIIACANVTNLLAARGMARTGEMALRGSLGATRGQIIAQLLTESFILVLTAGAAGVLAAHWILRIIISLFPAEAANLLVFSINETALLFAVILTFAVGVLVGLFPAFHGSRSDITVLLKEQGGQTTGSKSAARLRVILVIAQIAFSLTLLAVSGFFVKSFYELNRIDLGMNPDNIVIFGVSPSLNGYAQQQYLQFYERLEEELAAIPGVVCVTNSWYRMFSGNSAAMNVNAEGTYMPGGRNTRMDFVGANYLQTLGIQLISGRDFTNEDIHGAGGKAVIVNEAFAEKFEFGRDAVGKYVAIPSFNNLDYEIIGLAKNTKYHAVYEEKSQPFLFIPYSKYQFVVPGNLFFHVKTALPPGSVIPQIRGVVARLDPAIPIENLTTMAQTIRDSTFSNRLVFLLAVSIAFFATLMTAVGLYGIFAYDVARRRREIGLRMALGATRLRICLMFIRKAALIALTGGAISIALSIFAGRIVQSH